MNQSDEESPQRMVGEILEAIERDSETHHKELANKFLGLSLAVSFGSLAYLISLEQLLPPATSGSPRAIQIAWCAAYLSASFGAIHLWLETLLPLHARNMAVDAIRDVRRLGAEEVQLRAAAKTRRFLFGCWIHHLHIILLLLTIFSSAYYRFANL